MDRSEPSQTFSVWIFVFIGVVSSAAEAESLVMGSAQPITAAPGDDVVLPCHLEPSIDVQALTVEWSQPDLKPDPSDPLRRVQYVHLYRGRREVTDMKLPSFAGRTELFTEQLRRGNVSLKILNVTLADAGRYRCFIPKLKSPVREATVQLAVDPDSIKASTTETPLDPRNLTTQEPQDQTSAEGQLILVVSVVPVVCGILLLGVCLWLYYKHRHKGQDDPKTERKKSHLGSSRPVGSAWLIRHNDSN